MGRRLFNLAAAASLVLCVATAAFWVRSYWRNDSVVRVTNSRTAAGGQHYDARGIFSENGRLTFYTRHAAGATYGGPAVSVGSRAPDPPLYRDVAWQGSQERLNLGIIRWYRWIGRHSGGVDVDQNLEVSYWFLTLSAALTAALIAVRVWRSRNRSVRGRCPTCGYDLRATPEKCPECGAVPARRTSGATDDQREEPAAVARREG